MSLSAAERLTELERDPADTDMVDLDGLLRACGYECFEYGQFGTLLYRNRAWESTLTFPLATRTVPVGRLMGILAMVRANLMREGKL